MSSRTSPRGEPVWPQAESARPVPEPERLARDPRLGPLLERANAKYRAGLDEGVAFRRLLQRVARQQPRAGLWQRRGGWPLLAVLATGGLSAAALCVLVLRGAPRGDEPRIVLGPELRSTDSRVRQASVPSSARELEVVPSAHVPVGTEVASHAREGRPAPRERAATTERSERAVEAPPRSLARTRPARASSSVERETPPAAAGLPAPSAPVSASSPHPPAVAAQEDCLGLARTGQAGAAERCFSERASGSGLSAEMALYEVARLRRDVLHDAAGALTALREHGQRFPRGSLRNEVELSRIELLAELGRTREALLESEALLDSESGRERAAELHVLRGNVYHRDLGDPRSAAAEYARAQARGGALGAEAARLRGACLEALGDVDGALQAYRQYTSVPGQPHAGEVRRQIERLSALARERGSGP